MKTPHDQTGASASVGGTGFTALAFGAEWFGRSPAPAGGVQRRGAAAARPARIQPGVPPLRGAAEPAPRLGRGSPRSEHEVQSADQFLTCLQHEKRRSERSNAALSLVIYRLQPPADRQPELNRRLLELLRREIRQTDVLGVLCGGAVAVLCTHTGEDGQRGFTAKLGAALAGLPLTSIAATYPDQLFERLEQGLDPTVDPVRLLKAEGTPRSRRGYLLKRPLDVVLGLATLLLTAPLMLLAAAAIAIESRGPIIYRQQRLGLGGVPFVFYKFRSMWVDVDEDIHRAFVLRLIKRGEGEAQAGAAGAKPYKLQCDSRITRVGRLIRWTSIDELPQLLNVLKGEMSLVGPRPPIPYEAASYQPWHLRRILAVKPGITGLWQVEGRSRVSFNDMVRMDLRYIRECSLRLDIKILLKTVRVVVCGTGAR